MPTKLTTEQFVQKAIAVHGDRYDYSKVEYVNNNVFVKISCRSHGAFEQTPRCHLSGRGCRLCGFDVTFSSKRHDIDKFLSIANSIHGETYDYSLVNYRNSTEKVEIICKIHGSFMQSPNGHTNKSSPSGCPKCKYDKLRHNTKIFVCESRKIHGEKYDYSQTIYINAKRKLKIICPDHGAFEQTAAVHLSGSGCKMCFLDSWRLTTAEFIHKSKSVHGDKYDYSDVSYIGAKHTVKIICRQHGVFEQTAGNHMAGKGCHVCDSSYGETAVYGILTELGFSFKTEVKFDGCKNRNVLPFDFQVFTDDGFSLIEFHGRQHYEPVSYFGGEKAFQSTIKRDSIKSDWAIENNIPLLVIHYKEFEVGKEHLKSMLVDFLGQGKLVKHRRPKPKQFKQLNLFDDL